MNPLKPLWIRHRLEAIFERKLKTQSIEFDSIDSSGANHNKVVCNCGLLQCLEAYLAGILLPDHAAPVAGAA